MAGCTRLPKRTALTLEMAAILRSMRLRRAIRVCDPRVINRDERAFCRRLLEAAVRQPGVRKVEVDLPLASCLVEFDSGPASSLEMADLFAGCLLEAAAGYPDAVRPPSWLPEPRWLKLTGYPLSDDMLLESVQSDAVKPDRSPIEVATGAKRVGYLVLAGGAFAMTLVALVVPGIPTVPFLLATSYCLARSSRDSIPRSESQKCSVPSWSNGSKTAD